MILILRKIANRQIKYIGDRHKKYGGNVIFVDMNGDAKYQTEQR